MATRDGVAIFPWDSVERTKKLSHNDSRSGIREILILSYGDTLTGRIVEQKIGHSILFKLDEGMYMEINMPDILSIQSEPIADSVSIWEQVPMLDRIVLNDGTSVDGFISLREMGKSVTLLLKDGSGSKRYALSEIAAYQKLRKDDRGVSEMSLVQDVSMHWDMSDTACLMLKIKKTSGGVVSISEDSSSIVVELE